MFKTNGMACLFALSETFSGCLSVPKGSLKSLPSPLPCAVSLQPLCNGFHPPRQTACRNAAGQPEKQTPAQYVFGCLSFQRQPETFLCPTPSLFEAHHFRTGGRLDKIRATDCSRGHNGIPVFRLPFMPRAGSLKTIPSNHPNQSTDRKPHAPNHAAHQYERLRRR